MRVVIRRSGSAAEANTPLDPTAGMCSVCDSEEWFTRRGSTANRWADMTETDDRQATTSADD